MSSSPVAAAHFPAEGVSAGAARRFVAATLGDWGLAGLEETACLLVSELVSNVVLHAETDLDVHLRHADGRVRVEVHDQDPRLPQRKPYAPTSATGRGMVFIAELSRAWGAEPTADGKVVWFELDEEEAPADEGLTPGAELRLEDCEEWNDLAQTAIAGEPSRERPGTTRHASPRRQRKGDSRARYR